MSKSYQDKDDREAEENFKKLDARYNKEIGYEHRFREYGMGPIRIGDSLELREDLFALSFVC